MAKEYLDAPGVERLVEYLTTQFDAKIAELESQIQLLNKTDGTPGSIKQIVNDIISNTSVSDLKQDEELTIYGGSASELVNEEEVDNSE